MARSPDFLRRLMGGICLSLALGMLLAGQTVLKSRLDGMPFIYYWLTCLLFTMATLIIAALDLRAVRLRSRREQTALIEDALRAIVREKNKREQEGTADKGEDG